jgi:hypothetical protein
MKKLNLFACLALISQLAIAQVASDKEKVERACQDYIEGFYEGDTTKLIRSLKPALYKYGYWRSEKSESYDREGQMTFKQAVNYARNVSLKKNFAKADAPKKVEVFEVSERIASAKVTAWWGIDYMLLAKHNDQWMIEQVLWQAPPPPKK